MIGEFNHLCSLGSQAPDTTLFGSTPAKGGNKTLLFLIMQYFTFC